MTGQEHSTDSGKEAQTHFICIVPPIPFDIALLVHPLCNCLCMNFKLTHCSNSRNHNSYGNMKSRNKNNKLLALSWHIDNKLIIPCFLRPHHSYAPFSQCTLECVENELGFSYFFYRLPCVFSDQGNVGFMYANYYGIVKQSNVFWGLLKNNGTP